MAEEDVDWGMDEDFDPWQGAEEPTGVPAVENQSNVDAHERNGRIMQDREGGIQTGKAGRVENATESRQRPADQFAHLPIGWTCRTSRHHPDRQYFYNPYTRTAIWDRPEEPVFDESGITTPPLPQRRQEQPATLQIRSSGRLTDHMKMATIQDAPLATTSASNTVHRDTSQDRSSGNSASQPPATSSKLRLIDRIQPARYVPPEKHETISLRPQNGPSPRPGAGSSYRPDYSTAEPRAGPRDSPRTGDAYRPERVQTSSPSLTFKPQVPSTSSESQVKDDVFASQKHVEKLPEWLEANDPKLDSEVPSDRRRMREPEDTPNRSGSSKRARLDRDARPSTTAKDLPLPTSARASRAKDQDLPRGDDSSNHALDSRLSDKPNSRNMPPVENLRIRNSGLASANQAGSFESPRQAPSGRGPSERATPSASRTSDSRENERARMDNQGASAPAPFLARDRPLQSPAGPPGPSGNRTSPPSHRRPLPAQTGPRDGQRSGSNNAPLLANRWNASPRTTTDPDVKPASDFVPAPDREQAMPAPLEEEKPKEYAYGPKANKNLAMQSRVESESRRGPGAPVDANQSSAPDNSMRPDWRQSTPSQPTSARSFQETKDIQPVPRGRDSQAMVNPTDVTNANRMPLGAWGERGQPKYRAAEQAPVSGSNANDFRPRPSARDALNGDVRTAAIRAPSPPGPSSARSFTPDSKRGDKSFEPASNSRPPIPPVRTRSPVHHLPPQARAFNNERRSPPRIPVTRRRSPSPVRFDPGPPRFGERRDDRPARPLDGYAPMPSPRDAPRPHPRAPDLYTPGGNSPPRQYPRGPNQFVPRDDIREPRFDPRRGPNPRGPVGHR